MTSLVMLTSTQVAERLGLSRQGVAWRVARGHLTPTQKLPGRNGSYLFDPDEIDRIAAAEQGSADGGAALADEQAAAKAGA